MLDVLGVPADAFVLAQEVGPPLGRAHEPRGLGPVDQRGAAAPAVRVGVQVRLLPHEDSSASQGFDDVGVGVLDEASLPGWYVGVELPVGPDGVENREALLLTHVHVVGTESGGEVHDSRAFLGADEAGGDDLLAAIVDGQEVERPPVPEADQVGAAHALDHLHVLGGSGGGHDEIALAVGRAHAHVLDVGPDGGGDVCDQRPRRGRPHQEIEVAVLDGKAHVHREVGDLSVGAGLPELV